jgi:hypothetical protein
VEPELLEEARCDAVGAAEPLGATELLCTAESLGAGEPLTNSELLDTAEALGAFVALPTELPDAACELLRVVVLL